MGRLGSLLYRNATLEGGQAGKAEAQHWVTYSNKGGAARPAALADKHKVGPYRLYTEEYNIIQKNKFFWLQPTWAFL